MSAFDRELAVALDLAQRAGHAALPYFRQGIRVDRKPGDEPVTAADRAADALIVGELRKSFPQDGILSEEQEDHQSWAQYPRAWLVDPIDGTKEFIAQREGFSVMIGLTVKGVPTLGVLHQVTTGLTYFAVKGQGARLRHNGKDTAISATKTADPAQVRLVASRSNRSPKIDEVRSKLKIADETNAGSVGLKVGLIARGDRDLYVNPAKRCRLWDACAPQVILEEAGGKLTDLGGHAVPYDEPDKLVLTNGLLASNGACHAAVVEKIAPLFFGK